MSTLTREQRDRRVAVCQDALKWIRSPKVKVQAGGAYLDALFKHNVEVNGDDDLGDVLSKFHSCTVWC